MYSHFFYYVYVYVYIHQDITSVSIDQGCYVEVGSIVSCCFRN